MRDYGDWRKAFLARRGLERPNGDMLFAYRASKDEYLDLRSMFAAQLAALNGRAWIFGGPAECACFVLYAAEWWRREYAGGAWKWTHILQSIGPQFNLDVVERSYAVERGLRAWGHQPSGAGKRYLGAIVAQGGLPLQLVARGDGAIIRLLVRGTRQAQLYAWDSTRLEGFFAEHSQDLVQHLRDEDIYRLLTSVVLTVLSLRHECHLAGASNPVELLDRNLPGWRERFPMAVDDSSAEPLFVELVREAARDVKANITLPVLATRTLRPCTGESGYELALALETPGHVPVTALAAACGLAPERLPQAFALEAIGTTRLPLGDGRQLLGGNDALALLTGRSKRITGDAALHEQLLVLRGMGEDIHDPVAIPGADALDEALPWVFAVRNSETTLAGQGSCRLAEDLCLVAVPQGAELLPDGEGSAVTLKGETKGLTRVRGVYEVSGSATVLIDEVRFSIRTAQVGSLTDQLIWIGVRVPFAARPLAVFQGVPRLYRVAGDGVPVMVAERDLEWVSPVRGGRRIESPRAHRGPIDAWLLQGGVRVRRFRMALVSQDARIHFHSGESEREGAIELHGWGVSSAAAPPDLAGSQSIQNNLARVELCCHGSPPVSVHLAVCWGNSPYSIWLDLPFPAAGGRFADQTGISLSRGIALPLRRLQEVRAQVYDRNPEKPRRHKLTMSLVSEGAGRQMSEHHIPIDGSGFGEVRLLELESAIQGLMCQSNSLDARIELAICVADAPLTKLQLTRYDANLEVQTQALAVAHDDLARVSPEVLAGVKLRALPLLAADAEEVELSQSSSSGVPVGRWEAGHLPASKGPWLVYPAPDSTQQLRPTLFKGFALGHQPAAGDPQRCMLGAAMAVSDQAERAVALAQAVRCMSQDLDHPSWGLVTRQYDKLAHLPLSTLDYWRVMGRDVSSSVAVVLKLSFDAPTLMARMQAELGVMWSLTPLASLQEGLRRLTASLAAQFHADASDQLVRTVVESVFGSLAATDPIMGELVQLTLFQAGFKRNDGVDRLIAAVGAGPRHHLLQLWQGESSFLQRFLLRTHADDRIWPEFGLTKALAELLSTCAPEAAEQIATTCGELLLWLPTSRQFGPYTKNEKGDVANAPLLAGLLAQLCPDQAAWRSDRFMAQLRRIRSFDPGWFEVACRTGTLIAIITTEQPRKKTPARPGGRYPGVNPTSPKANKSPADIPGPVRRVPRSVG